MATTKKATRERAAKPAKAKDEPMKITGKAHASVSDMVHDTCDAGFADEFDEHLNEHRISKILTVIRCKEESTQEEVGEKMGCGQAKVSKIERTADHELNFGDIVKYSQVLGQAIHVVFMPAMTDTVDHIRFHLNSIKHELARLVKLAGADRVIGDGVEAYAIDNVEKYISMIDDTLNKSLTGRSRRGRRSASKSREDVANDYRSTPRSGSGRHPGIPSRHPDRPSDSAQEMGRLIPPQEPRTKKRPILRLIRGWGVFVGTRREKSARQLEIRPSTRSSSNPSCSLLILLTSRHARLLLSSFGRGRESGGT